MASKIQKHAARMKRVNARIESLRKIRDTKLRFMVTCGDGYKREAATVRDDGSIDLGSRTLSRDQARDFATWILEQHAGHVEPPTEKKEEA